MKLNSEEFSLARQVGFDEEVCALIKTHARAPLNRLVAVGADGESEPSPGVSVAVKDGEEAERLMNVLCEPLISRGCRAFWSERHEPNGLKETDEVAVLKTEDPYAMLHIRQTDGGNYDISTEDIIERLEDWRKLAEFDVVGASRDWVAVQFSRLPENICAFAEGVYLFCPDTVTQGVGFTERHNSKKIDAARKLCPKGLSASIRHTLAKAADDVISKGRVLPPALAFNAQSLQDEVGTGIRLLAYEIQQTKLLFLWWD